MDDRLQRSVMSQPDDVPDSSLSRRVWWVNQGRSYPAESAAGIVFAGISERNIGHHRDVGRMEPGDVVLHYRQGSVVALGETVADPVQGSRPYGDPASRDHGWLTRVEYFPLAAPVAIGDLPRRAEVRGPFNVQGGVNQGYLFSLPSDYAAEVRSLFADRWPPGSPWSSTQRRYWLFQANPAQWNLAEEQSTMPMGGTFDWTVTRYRAEMEEGDGLLLWQSGRQSGLYSVARLTGRAELAATPDFRPVGGPAQEHRVGFTVVRHARPHVPRSVVKDTPLLSGLGVLSQPQGTNYRVTQEQWRAALALVPLEDRGDPAAWDTLLHWARRFSETVDLDRDEREYKLDFATKLQLSRSALAAGEDWVPSLHAALRATNVLNYRDVDRFKALVAEEPAEVEAALGELWDSGSDPVDAVAAFTERLPQLPRPGTSASIASLLRAAVDAQNAPIFKPTAFAKAYSRVGWPATSPPVPSARYREAVAFLDEFKVRYDATVDVVLRDRLDAQGLLWRVVSGQPPDSWSESEQQAYRAFVGGDDVSDIAELVQQFRHEHGYPTEKDINRGVERRDLATALSREALADPDEKLLNQLAGPAYGSPRPQPGFNVLLKEDESRAAVAASLTHLLHGEGDVVDRLDSCIAGAHKLDGVGEAILVKALAVWDPKTWFPGYVAGGKVGKLKVLELLGIPVDPTGSKAQVAARTNGALRRVLDPFFPDDPWGVQTFAWWVLHRENVPDDDLQQLADELYLTKEFLDEAEELLADKGQVVFYGPPGTGKTFVARKLAGHIARGGGTVEKVQFHPSYAYEDFVEGYRPRLSSTGHVTYAVVDGPLKRIAAQATERPDVTHVLLIDELNRGNVAKILGELLFLLEYRDEEIRLQYSDGPFSLPENLKVIGTMNTADRSIALVDTALRRRFHFVAFFPDAPPIDAVLRRWLADRSPELLWVADVVDRANAELADRNLAIGPSHFLKDGLTERHVERAWKASVLPFLEEHFFGDPEQLRRFDLARLRRGSTDVVPPGPEDGRAG